MPELPDVVFFDMDHTLIDNDCDVSWKEFLIGRGLAPASEHADIYRFWDLYSEGRLPEREFLEFQLRQFKGRSPAEMASLAESHYAERVRPRVYPQARAEIARLRRAGVPAAMLTATNALVAAPVQRALGLDALLATELELDSEGLFTGGIAGEYCIREGKIGRAAAFCDARATTLDRALYYGDSVSDIPMLERVGGGAIVVNPKGALLDLALRRGWRIEKWALP